MFQTINVNHQQKHKERRLTVASASRRPVAVTYLRTAVRRQRKANPSADPIEGQRRECRALAQRFGCDIIAEFTDIGVSGLRRDRAGLLALLGFLITHPEVRHCLISDQSRLARDSVSYVRLERQLAAFGVAITIGSDQ